ncbi:FAS1/BIgH3 domain [Carpediemonas membranifera]|uniref:FAS1/BIgH3 domain n=1 Tax=Carpediemonas membranifera TaxID=201153 RepID=A0A8J6E3N5_9EUKA|nr:FAS1/BIgH3 domain [Carpediemonas membranifera]|eukprot:KAG9393412.1 FAS1/BIgH3 domain [Carpediemonas membranifera]
MADDNVFYQHIRAGKNKSNFFDVAAANRLTIFIPTNQSLSDMYGLPAKKLDKSMIRDHIFKPSPVVKNHLISLSGKEIALDLDAGLVHRLKGWFRSEDITIKSEVTNYNGNFDAYMVYTISEPLSVPKSFQKKRKEVAPALLDIAQTPEEYTALLKDTVGSPALAALEKDLAMFRRGYLIDSSHLDDAKETLADIVDRAVQRIVQTCPAFVSCQVDAKRLATLRQAVVHITLAKVRPDIITKLGVAFVTEKGAYAAACRSFRVSHPTRPEQAKEMGLPETICRQLGMPEFELIGKTLTASIAEADTPGQIAQATMHATDRALALIETDEPVTADSMIPLTAVLLLQGDLDTTAALSLVNILYARHFNIGGDGTTQYRVTTLEAAAKHIMGRELAEGESLGYFGSPPLAGRGSLDAAGVNSAGTSNNTSPTTAPVARVHEVLRLAESDSEEEETAPKPVSHVPRRPGRGRGLPPAIIKMNRERY